MMKTILKASLISFLALGTTQSFAQDLTFESSESERFLAPRIPAEVVDAFNVQIKNELDGAHFYLSVSNYFYLKSLDGFGFWFLQQYYEELNHARLLMDFLKKKNAAVVLKETASPDPLAGETPAAIFAQSLQLEETQSARIQKLQEVAQQYNSRDAVTYLQWFIDEQVQEEDHFQNVVDRIDLVSSSLEGILLIDQELALRAPAVLWMPGQPLPPH